MSGEIRKRGCSVLCILAVFVLCFIVSGPSKAGQTTGTEKEEPVVQETDIETWVEASDESVESEEDRNALEEQHIREWEERQEQERQFLQTLTVGKLRDVTLRFEEGFISSEECYDPADAYFIIDELEDEDVTLYGMFGGDVMVLREGEDIFPFWVSWVTMYRVLPELYRGDYDLDGEIEYAEKRISKTGTGTYGEDLYIIEKKEDTFSLQEFTEEERLKALSEISYEYNEQYQILTVHADNGKTASLSLRDFLEGCGADGQAAEFEELIFGDIECFFEIDGAWYYEADGGIKADTFGWVQYECEMKMMCRVFYDEAAGFSFGPMQFAPNYYNQAMQPIPVSVPEKVIHVTRADLTHDGREEEIVVSMTCMGGGDGTYEELFGQGEICYVRVYLSEDGMDVYNPEEWASTGGYNVSSAIWESAPLAQAHAGNGMVFLAKRDGKEYLVTANAGIWQGEFSAQYQAVLLCPSYEMNFVVDEAEVNVDLNACFMEDIEFEFPVEEANHFTEALEEWLKDAVLLAGVDINEARIGVTGNETYHAKDIWKEVEQVLEEQQ